jgi:hypothetical protein
MQKIEPKLIHQFQPIWAAQNAENRAKAHSPIPTSSKYLQLIKSAVADLTEIWVR